MVAQAERQVTSAKEINRLLSRAWIDFQPIQLRARIRRALINRDMQATFLKNYVGTSTPVPYDKSPLIINAMVGHPAEATQFYASRFASNAPTVEVMPLTVTDDVTDRLDKIAGKQELFDALLLDSMGIGTDKRANHRKCAYAQAVTEAAYYVLIPRDLGFGMPGREYYSDEEAAALKAAGKRLGPLKGDRGWPEHADDWSARKKQISKDKARSALDYFDLQVYPRDMVMKGKDSAGLKWADVVESIPADECGPGSDIARYVARKNGVPEDDVDLWGLWKDQKGQIIGGLERGGPPSNASRSGNWTLHRWFNRIEMVYLVTSGNDLSGGQEIYRCKHGATDEGRPVVPVFEVPAMRTDIETTGQEFIGPMSQVFAYAPLVNQLMTLFSGAGVYNSVPRFYVVLQDGTILRDDNGEPKFFDSAPVPGLDASQIGAYAGEIQQLLVDTDTLEALLPIYLEQLAQAMPSPAAQGDAGSSSAAWLAQQNIQQSQQTIKEPVDNHREAVGAILRVCHGYLRPIKSPLFFFHAPGQKGDERVGRGLVEFDPADLTDSFVVQQDLDTPEERTVRLQIGNELAAIGRIDDREYFNDYMKVPDAREAIIKQDQQKLVNAWKYGAEAAGMAPDSGMYQFLQQMIGNVHYAMLQHNMQYALNFARQQAQMGAQQAAMELQGQADPAAPSGTPQDAEGGMGGGAAEAAGIRRPGMGMSTTLQGQLGDRVQAPLPGGGM